MENLPEVIGTCIWERARDYDGEDCGAVKSIDR